MIKIRDVDIEAFVCTAKGKKIIAIGAGRKLKAFIGRHELKENVIAIVDADQNKKSVDIEDKILPVRGYDFLTKENIRDCIILITAYIPLMSIIERLDGIEDLDGVECYVAPLMEEKFDDAKIRFSRGRNIIPKTIHYFWFGEKEIPLNLQYYISTWKEMMPEYEIIRWDEKTYDVSKNQYMREAYQCKKYGFVPDYARLDILYKYGGIYLDTDVEVIKSFDDLLCDQSFMGFFDKNVVAIGAAFGCVKGNDLIGILRDEYEGKSFFDKDGNMNLTTCVEYQYPVLEKYGFSMDNKQQCINGNMLYPVQMFNPEAKLGIHTHYTEDTHSIHHSQVSYESRETRQIFYNRTDFIKRRIERQL